MFPFFMFLPSKAGGQQSGFPETIGEMDKDEVMEAQEQRKKTWSFLNTDDSDSMFSLKEQEVFGKKTELINFRFYNLTGNRTQEFC